ncbi:SDR family oxidoreductase [Coraliomargarita algicola]|uniref:SDR family oxidoreductase n=1 Tax=Coraliomargarita algicola TaxID=3092156 RepID=A0ABZ0RR22_9BACT|nr:SDR family oxidoreductase [Coraliomargarita sp. J2-16]WPJ97818.1 SDR family oxidoreductase [Coraliomargarita sp. J2-16]
MTTNYTFGPNGWTPEQVGSLAGKTYAITGANSGAGYQAARLLLSKGAQVMMLNRSAEKSAAAIEGLKQEFGREAELRLVRMDLAVLESVREAAAEVLETLPRIDALICNGAIAQVAQQEMTVNGFESHLGVNHLGHFLLCGLLFVRIQESAGRIVVVGSNAYRMGLKRIQFEDLNFDQNYSAWNAYAQSKLAQMMFGYELQRRVQAAGKQVQVYVCHPGAARTSLIRENANCITRALAALLSPLAQSAERGAWPEVMCATQAGLKSEKLYGPTQRGEMVGPVGECALAGLALDQEQAHKLWKLSEEKTSMPWLL